LCGNPKEGDVLEKTGPGRKNIIKMYLRRMEWVA
jgi:hypothetical protein